MYCVYVSCVCIVYVSCVYNVCIYELMLHCMYGVCLHMYITLLELIDRYLV